MRRHRFGALLLVLSVTVLTTGALVTLFGPDAAVAGEAAGAAPAPEGEPTPVATGAVDLDAAQTISIASRARSVFGIGVILAICVLFSSKRTAIKGRTIAMGIMLQVIFMLLLLWTTPGMLFFEFARTLVNTLLSFTDAGSSFLFGNLYLNSGTAESLEGLGKLPYGAGPIMVKQAGSENFVEMGFIFAIHVLPTIIFFSSLMSIMYHLGVMQLLVKGVASVMLKFMRTSGSESLSCAANIFVGQTEAPLVIRPYIDTMTRSELMAIMTGGFATVAGGVMAAYVRFGIDAGHLMAASVMSAPAALVIAKLMIPETEESQTAGQVKLHIEKTTENVIDAAAAGASDGFKLACNVGAMLLAFIALIAGADFGLGKLSQLFNWVFGTSYHLDLQTIFGLVFAPLAWCMGAEHGDVMQFGNLLGQKVAVNEFVAYITLGGEGARMHPRTFMIATYALCGFANFASIAIQVGGISSIAPKRRGDLAKIGLKAMFAGALASWLTATLAGALAPAPGPAKYDMYYGANVTFAMSEGENRFGDARDLGQLGLANARAETARIAEEIAALPATDATESARKTREELEARRARWVERTKLYETELGRIEPLAAERWDALEKQAQELIAAGEKARARAVYEKAKSSFGLVEYTSKADAALFKLGE